MLITAALGIGDLITIAAQFDTFEKSASAVGRLNAMLGGPFLNSVQMVYATESERNRAILESNSLNWKLRHNPVPVIKNDAYEIALDLIAKRDSCFSVWGFKDPRSCLLLDFWHSVLRNPKYIITLKHKLSPLTVTVYKR